jgi:phospholipid transport system substrate-binding protein
MSKLLDAALALAAGLAFAQPPAPDAFVKSITDDVLATVRADPEIQAGDGGKISALVQAKILPHFDFARASAIAVGPQWRRATPAQREAFTGQFEMLVVRTYSNALAAYRDQVIAVLPAHMNAEDTEVTVRSQVKQSGTAPITLDYTMERMGDDWKVFDIAVDGMSLVSNYRTTFRQTIDQQGMDGLIAALTAKNAGR